MLRDTHTFCDLRPNRLTSIGAFSRSMSTIPPDSPSRIAPFRQAASTPLERSCSTCSPKPTCREIVTAPAASLRITVCSAMAAKTRTRFDIRSDRYATSKEGAFVRYSFYQQDIYRNAILDGLADGSGIRGGRITA